MSEPIGYSFRTLGTFIGLVTYMPAPTQFVVSAEAAFIAGLSDRQMNRVIDEDLMPKVLFDQRGSTRRFTRLCAAFAKFYFDTESVLVAAARRQILEEITQRVVKWPTKRDVLALLSLPEDANWKVIKHAVEIDLAPYIANAFVRARDVEQADALVSTDAQIMGGVAVFAGTRVPIDGVLASLHSGVSMNRLKASYPFLGDTHIYAAKVYQQVHPKRGRPRRLADVNAVQTRRVSRVVRPARA